MSDFSNLLESYCRGRLAKCFFSFLVDMIFCELGMLCLTGVEDLV